MSDTEKFVYKLQECVHNREPITLFGVDYAPMDDIGLLETIIAGIDEENAKLRTFLGGGSIITDYWKDEDGTMHVLTTDGEHTYEYMRGGLADENAKLRELVADYFNAPCVTCDPWGDGFRCTHCESGNCTLAIRTLELGIEVDG